MKLKFILAICLFALSFNTQAQYVSASTIQAINNLVLAGKKVNGISNDSSMIQNDSVKLATQSAIKGYVDNHTKLQPPQIFNWSVLDSVNTVALPTQGNIYLVSTAPTGTFTGHSNQIAQYDTAAGYTYNTASVGDLLYNAASQQVSRWNGTAWLQVTVNNYVHISYPETILGKKTFADTLNLLNKPIQIISTPNAPVSLLVTRSAGVAFPWLTIIGTRGGSKITMGANNPASAADMLRISANYTDSIWTGTYRPLVIDAYDYLDLGSDRSGIADSATRFRVRNLYAGVIHYNLQWTYNGYASRAFYKNDTTAWKPLVIDNLGNIAQSSWLGASGGGGSYHLPYNGISTNYLGGDTAYHALPTYSIPSLDTVVHHGNSSSIDILVNGLTVGRGAGNVNTNTSLGVNSLLVNTTGYRNTAIGMYNQYSNTTGNSNTSLGAYSLDNNIVGVDNTAIGAISMVGTKGDRNTGVGSTSLWSNTTGNRNVAVGYWALFGLSTGNNNVGIGGYAGNSINGSYNTSVGDSSNCCVINSLNNTTSLGSKSQPTQSNQVVLGDSTVTQVLTYGNVLSKVAVKSSDPTTTDIPSGFTAVFRNSTSGNTYLWANIGGTLLKVQLN